MTHSVTSPSRRSVAKGIAWAAPALSVGAVAPALAASCTGNNNYDANLQYRSTCTGSGNCQVDLRICNASTAPCGGTAQSVPSGTQVTFTITNNSTAADAVSKAPPAGYTIISRTASSGPQPPASGAGTIGAGVTWTYVVQTTQAIPPGSCIQVTWQQLDQNRSYTMTGSINIADGNPSNNSVTMHSGPVVTV